MASGCQLYLSIPADFSGPASLVEAVLAAGRVPSLLVLGATQPTGLRALRDAAHRQNAALVIENDIGLAKSVGADGVHLRLDGPSAAQARDALGPDAIVGADCGLSRHDAMALGEAGADYVAFGANGDSSTESLDDLADMIDWWSGLIEMPCAVWLPREADQATLTGLVAAGADFILPGPEIWAELGGVREWVERAALSCGIERARVVS
jgi:thiamine-phosphate pyrophosphorylase